MTTILFFVERIMITRCFVAGQDAGLALVLKLFSYISENMYIGNFIYIYKTQEFFLPYSTAFLKLLHDTDTSLFQF